MVCRVGVTGAGLNADGEDDLHEATRLRRRPLRRRPLRRRPEGSP